MIDPDDDVWADLSTIPAFQAVAALANDDIETTTALLADFDARDAFAACAMWAKLIESAAGEPHDESGIWTFEVTPAPGFEDIDVNDAEPGLIPAMQMIAAFSNDDAETAFAIFSAHGAGDDVAGDAVTSIIKIAAGALRLLVDSATEEEGTAT